jgi:oligosaccharide repeat unit polymerase
MTTWIYLGISFAVLLVATVNIFSSAMPSPNWSADASVVTLLWLASYFIATTFKFRTIYLISTTFIIPLCVFHLSWIYIDALGIGEIAELALRVERKLYAEAAWYTILALACIGVGMSIVMLRRRATNGPLIRQDAQVTRNLAVIYWMSIGLLLASGVFFFMFLAVVGNPFAYARTEFFETDAAGRGLGAFLMVFPGAAVSLVISAQKPRQKILAWTVAAIGAALVLFSGYRSAVLFPILIGGALLAKTGRKIPIWVPIVAALAIITIIPAITQIRQVEYGDIDTELVQESIESTTAVDGFIELGGTLGVFAKTLTVVPKSAPYQWGKTYYVAVRDAIPNLTYTMQAPQRADALKSGALNNEQLFNLSPADWMTFYINPYAFRKGTGVGFSAVAEPYINFGYVGVLAYFIMLGATFAYLDGLDLRYHPWILFMCSSVGWALLKTVRNTSGEFIKPMIFTLIVIAIWRMISFFLPAGKRLTTV